MKSMVNSGGIHLPLSGTIWDITALTEVIIWIVAIPLGLDGCTIHHKLFQSLVLQWLTQHLCYYLDEDNNGTPEYFLNFGPPWYEPQSGATRPQNGDQIDIVGGLINNGNYPMIIVYEINGLFWRDSSFFGGHMGGGWMHRNMTQPMQFNTPFDDMDWIEMQPGWHMGGGHHGGMHDSLFCQILEIMPGSINTLGNENAFAGYQLHYTDAELQSRDIDESTIQVKYWDTHTNGWATISNASLNPSNNTVTFSASDIGNFFILTGDSPTSVETTSNLTVEDYRLDQNFPNPFNPTTIIKYQISDVGFVTLKVYDVLGNEVALLVNEKKEVGSYEVEFNASNLSSGVYVYQLNVNDYINTKKMVLMK
jgi:hypothetical protein